MSDKNLAENQSVKAETGKTDGTNPEVGKPEVKDRKPSESEKTFTQADVDRIIKGRLAKYEKAALDVEKVQAERDEAIAKAVAQAKAEVSAESALRVAEESARVVATQLNFHDAEDALAGVALAEYVDDSGEVDRDGLRKAFENLAQRKPYLVKQGFGVSARDIGLGMPNVAGAGLHGVDAIADSWNKAN
ncbi:hypothetical protein ACU19_04890 [Actinobaculum suis]|uniref:hypothetical protein n=1 Tax=Actinobaculum suis TaxID=1657 RepID=UPI00066FCC18|nr:hypothetical protein [Actinobaculum suis]KMY23311.1 hypothetical protein ACU19_04890 [Actinobaculum suis]